MLNKWLHQNLTNISTGKYHSRGSKTEAKTMSQDYGKFAPRRLPGRK